jgi:hypothetical protein
MSSANDVNFLVGCSYIALYDYHDMTRRADLFSIGKSPTSLIYQKCQPKYRLIRVLKRLEDRDPDFTDQEPCSLEVNCIYFEFIRR